MLNRMKFVDKVLITETLKEMVKMQNKYKVPYEQFLDSLDNYKAFLISGGYLYRREQFDTLLNKAYEESGH